MSATTESPVGVDSSAEEGGRPHPEGGQHGAHPGEKQYILVALVLGVITAIEVGLSYWKNVTLSAPFLLVGMVLKFVLVAAFFMHLKFDSKVFRRLFIAGISLAIFCYLILQLMFHSFTHEIQIRPQGPTPVVTAPTTVPPPTTATTTATGG